MRYFLGLFFIFIGVFLAIYFGLRIFRGSPAPAPSSTATVATLPDYASTDAEVSVIIDGPVVGDEQHRAIRITVSRDERTLDVIQGYSGLVISTKSFDNSQAAYDVFLRAINGLGFTKSRKVVTTDDRGVCPTGNRYFYELKNTGSSDTDKRLWSASCNIKLGTYIGNGPGVRDLFQKQIPEYGTLTSGISL